MIIHWLRTLVSNKSNRSSDIRDVVHVNTDREGSILITNNAFCKLYVIECDVHQKPKLDLGANCLMATLPEHTVLQPIRWTTYGGDNSETEYTFCASSLGYTGTTRNTQTCDWVGRISEALFTMVRRSSTNISFSELRTKSSSTFYAKDYTNKSTEPLQNKLNKNDYVNMIKSKVLLNTWNWKRKYVYVTM